jgi:hypothetical protein
MVLGRWLKAARMVDDLVPPAAELGNEVLVDDHWLVRLAGPAFALFAIGMIPWTIYIAISLPSRQRSPHYDFAWAGFDVMLLLALAATGFFALRRSRYLSVAATSAATILIIDAWFDVLTSREADRPAAIAFAVLIELPLSAVCWWLSKETQAIAEKRIALLLPKTQGRLQRDANKAATLDTGEPSRRLTDGKSADPIAAQREANEERDPATR